MVSNLHDSYRIKNFCAQPKTRLNLEWYINFAFASSTVYVYGCQTSFEKMSYKTKYNSYNNSYTYFTQLGHYYDHVSSPRTYPHNHPLSKNFVGNVHSSFMHVALWEFDGLARSDSFFDWLDNLEKLFAYHSSSNSCKICLANILLVSSAKTY